MRAQAAQYGADMETRERKAQEVFLKMCERIKPGEKISISRPKNHENWNGKPKPQP